MAWAGLVGIGLGRKDCDSGGRKCCWGGGSGFVPAGEAAGCAVRCRICSCRSGLGFLGWLWLGGGGSLGGRCGICPGALLRRLRRFRRHTGASGGRHVLGSGLFFRLKAGGWRLFGRVLNLVAKLRWRLADVVRQ